jgi:hypothetical protein
MESSVRVVVANRPRLLRELVLSTLSGQAGIEAVGEAENEQDVPSLGLAIRDAGCSGVAGLQEVFVNAQFWRRLTWLDRADRTCENKQMPGGCAGTLCSKASAISSKG